MMSEGAEAKIYTARLFGKELLVKSREAKRYRIPQLDLSIRRWRTKNEARIMRALEVAGIPVPQLLALGEFTIYMEKLDGKLMKDTEPDQESVSESGRILALMHNKDIIHGDFTPANIMVDNGAVSIIDFGLSGFSKDVEEKALDLLLMKRSLPKSLYRIFEKSYARKSKNAGAVLRRLAEIELRGRYQSRTLA